MTDLTTELRRAALTHLENTAAVTAIFSTSIYPMAVPADATFPMIKTGRPIARPYEASVLRGERIRFSLQLRCKPIYVGRDIVETAEDLLGRGVGAVKAALHNNQLQTPSGFVKLRMINDIRGLDGSEADAHEAVLEFDAKMMA